MEQHNKIIKSAAKDYLISEGLFQIGSSRRYFEDNGYFLTVVDFEPSGLCKGTYLNVGIDFLWEKSIDLNEVLSYDCGGRIIIGKGTQFAEYRERIKNADEIFTAKVEEFAVKAVDEVKEYRKFRDAEYCKNYLITKIQKLKPECCFWEVYNLSMICFYMGEFDEGKKYFEKFLTILQNHYYDWVIDFYKYCISDLIPQLNCSINAQKMVFEMINRRRRFFNSKPSYKKMRKDIIFQSC